jgi:nucleoid-associated protein YgaU
VRLYLNESFIAPGSVGGDGNVSFAIGRGVRPGDYRIRLDDVDPVSGGVKSRAEVAFNVPVPVSVPPVPPVQAPAANLPAVASASPSPPPAPQAAASPAPAPAVAPPAAPAAAPDPAVAPSSNPKVASAAPEPRDLPPGTIVIPDVNTAIISRGDNLWRISQRIYGQGFRYTEIYGANRGQIRNPNLIYPGQVFVVPGEGGPKQN